MIAPARPRPGRGDSARGPDWFGARLVADFGGMGTFQDGTLWLLSADTCSRRDRRETTQVPASLRNKSGRPGFVKILGPLLPPPASALRFLPALSWLSTN